jgi:hypothetical protein
MKVWWLVLREHGIYKSSLCWSRCPVEPVRLSGLVKQQVSVQALLFSSLCFQECIDIMQRSFLRLDRTREIGPL